MRIKEPAGVEFPPLDVLQLVKEIPASLARGIREQLGVDIPHEPEMLKFQPLQPIVIEIDVNNSLDRDPGINQRAHPLVCHIRLARAAHPRDDSCGILFFKIIDRARLDVFGNPEFVKLTQNLSKNGFHGA